MYRRLFVVLNCVVLFTLGVFLAGCGSPEPAQVAQATLAPTDTAVPTETATNVPTDTPEPTATASATASATATTPPTETATATEPPTKTPTPAPTETAVPTNTPLPLPTQTAAPPPPAAPPPSGAPPTGPNLLVNPGFEYGADGWNVGISNPVKLESASNFATFIHSGSYSAFGYVIQVVENVQPGVNYRAGAWLKIWTSDGENRDVSENPGDLSGKICINTNGDRSLNLPTTICSGAFQPLDTWQFITVDAIPINGRVTIFLTGDGSTANKRVHNELYWDDAQFGLSPVQTVATPTPPPPSRPQPPSPVPFNAQAMRDNMNNARSMLEQMGGLLDRLLNGSRETCTEYYDYYRGLVASPRYDGVPGEWQGVYNEYIFAVENGSRTNEPIFETCFSGNGVVTALNYGQAREGINTSLNRLIPAIEAVNGLPNP